MPQIAKGPRLWLRRGKDGRQALWVVKDGKRRFSTGTDDLAKAEKILASYTSCPKHFLNANNKRRRLDPRKVRWVYFIEIQAEDRPVKIGVANDARARLWNIQTSTPFPVALLASVEVPAAVEARIHDLLAADRIRGEWFRRSATLEAIIDAAKSGQLQNLLASNGPEAVPVGRTEKGENHASL